MGDRQMKSKLLHVSLVNTERLCRIVTTKRLCRTPLPKEIDGFILKVLFNYSILNIRSTEDDRHEFKRSIYC